MATLTLEGFTWTALAVLCIVLFFFVSVLVLVEKEIDHKTGHHYHKNHPDKDQH